MTEIGNKIKELRTQLGLTQEELAAKVGYKTKSAINKIELGINDLPQKKIVAFAEALETTPATLMGWDEETYDILHETATEMYKKEPTDTDGLTDNQKLLIDFAKTLSEDQATLALRLLKSLVEAD